jgi:hypothetical protein
MRIFCILTGLIVSAVGLLALLAHPTQMVPGMTLATGAGLLYWGTFTLNRKSRRIFAGRTVTGERRAKWSSEPF